MQHDNEPSGNVINLSKHSFTKTQYDLLNKNLNFCPTPGYYNKKCLKKDVENFNRKIKLKAFFQNTKEKNETEQNQAKLKIKTKSSWEPKKNHHTIESFIEAVDNDINNIIQEKKKLPKSNLTYAEKEAIEYFSKRNDIIITKADKGGATVVLDVNDYISKANKLLDDNNSYEKLKEDPTMKHADTVNKSIESFMKQNLLDKSTAQKLTVEDPRTSHFYILPKIHKPDIPGRPVVSSVDCHTSKISKFVDHYLQPHAQALPSYIQDTTDFINKINKTENITENTFLVTLDVKSLYTNIPNHEGIEAAKEALNSVNEKPIATKVIIKFLFLILTLNNFIFNGLHYLQKIGCAMGTICAPTYANIFMGEFEKKFIYPCIKSFCNFYCRFIDDIFLLWNGTEEELLSFISKLNKCHPTIKFDFKYSKEQIDFLDTTVYKNRQKNKLYTKIYHKPTDQRNFLHHQSAHPKSLIKSIPYAQAIRVKKICSEQSELNKNLDKLKTDFVKRGYNENFVEEQFERISTKERKSLLEKKSTLSNQTRIPLVITYNTTLPNIKEIIYKHWNLLQINTVLRPLFEEKPIIAYRRNKNLRDLIGGNRILNNRKIIKVNATEKRSSSTPCRTRPDNLCCHQVVNTETFSSFRTGESFKIFHQLNCKSYGIIYLLQCKICSLQYIGKSETPFNLRLNNHRKDTKDKKSKNIILACKHFQDPSHDFQRDARFTLIEKITKKCASKEQLRQLLKKRENFWILKLDTLHPAGLNQELNDL